MGADKDIVESFRTDMTCAVRLRRPLLECEVTEWADKFAAEIAKLRGEVEALGMQLSDEVLIAKRAAPAMPNGVEGLVESWRVEADRLRAINAEMEPDGTTHRYAEWMREKNAAQAGALSSCARALEALRAADNRDAAGVDDSAHGQSIDQRDEAYEVIDRLCDAVLGTDRAEWSSMYDFDDAVLEVEEAVKATEDAIKRLSDALNAENGPTFMGEPVLPPAPAAVPAGEAVAWVDEAGTLYPCLESVNKYLPRGRTVQALYTHPPAAEVREESPQPAVEGARDELRELLAAAPRHEPGEG